jgi:GT2 family glycosyltransferase
MRNRTTDPEDAASATPVGGAAIVPFPQRPAVNGKFLATAGQTLWVRGVTYGTFRRRPTGLDYPPPAVLDRDFAAMAAAGFNAVRTYTVPPRSLLDLAARHGLRVMVGVPWEQHIAFLDDGRRRRGIDARIRLGVHACAGHPAVLAYALGNEIPASVVRWHGRRRVERFLAELAEAARAQDPTALLTYVNYPTTEYLEVPWADISTFNVYLEAPAQLDAYVARLHNLAGPRPLVLAEIGLDSRRHGELEQARMVAEQVRIAFGAGCAGTFVFAWTDEWHRGGHDVLDWDFGLTDRARRPKPALRAVRRAFADVPFPRVAAWPRISVVVCSYNGARTIDECLQSLAGLRYPDYEVIVVDDGSTDDTAAIARRHDVRLVSTPNRGLSAARNTGLALATGEIVAYIDDDAHADPHWLTYLAATFLSTDHVGVGGPNVPPPGDGEIAHAVAASPGGPVHVLLSDREAEHLPGCNMAFRASALRAIGGFDPRFRTAGDDVDICWRLRDAVGTLGFSATALVWHHRRNSVRAYWRQQVGYGRAEALLERKWPERYNAAGHARWAGRLYGAALGSLGWGRPRIYHGTWGLAPFQSVYPPAPGLLASVMAMPEWYLIVGALAALAGLGVLWAPLLVAWPLLAIAVGGPLAAAVQAALAVQPPAMVAGRGPRLRFRALVAALHLLQPAARLRGRLRAGLTPWRQRAGPRLPRLLQTFSLWTEQWRAPDERLLDLERRLRETGVVVRRGGDFDAWDLEVPGGLLGAGRLVMLAEEHGAGRQLTRFRAWPRCYAAGAIVTTMLGTVAFAAILDGAPGVGAGLAAAALALGGRMLLECGGALGAVAEAWEGLARDTPGATVVRPGEVGRRAA